MKCMHTYTLQYYVEIYIITILLIFNNKIYLFIKFKHVIKAFINTYFMEN